MWMLNQADLGGLGEIRTRAGRPKTQVQAKGQRERVCTHAPVGVIGEGCLERSPRDTYETVMARAEDERSGDAAHHRAHALSL